MNKSGAHKKAFEFTSGEEFEPSELYVTKEFNNNYLHAVEDLNTRYTEHTTNYSPVIHPGLLINYSNITRSPSFYLPSGMAAIHTHEEIHFLEPGRLERRLTITWKVVESYEKRGRPYQVVNSSITDEQQGKFIIRRTTTNVYVGGPFRGIN